MRRLTVWLAAMAVSGCVAGPPIFAVSQTPTELELRVRYDVPVQSADNTAIAYCSQHGRLLPRLASRTPIDGYYVAYRYECITPPPGVAVPVMPQPAPAAPAAPAPAGN